MSRICTEPLFRCIPSSMSAVRPYVPFAESENTPPSSRSNLSTKRYVSIRPTSNLPRRAFGESALPWTAREAANRARLDERRDELTACPFRPPRFDLPDKLVRGEDPSVAPDNGRRPLTRRQCLAPAAPDGLGLELGRTVVAPETRRWLGAHHRHEVGATTSGAREEADHRLLAQTSGRILLRGSGG